MNSFLIEERYSHYTNDFFSDNLEKLFYVPSEYTTKKQNMPYLVKGGEKYIDLNNGEHSCLVVLDDGCDNFNLPCFQKTRIIGGSNLSILLKLHKARHWALFYENKDLTTWNKKKNSVVWRGAATGGLKRINFCKLYYKKYDIGLSSLFKHNVGMNHLLKNKLSISDFLSYKFIVSLEGNDKDSGINWKLGSNSLVIMPKPKMESWLMESKLIPWVHYAPLNDDCSDLDHVLDICLSNEGLCESIVNNAHEFMDQFRNLDQEEQLNQRIKNDYYSFVKLNVVG